MSGQRNSDHLPLMPGDRVEVRSAAEIMATLDRDGCLDRLPFMPEMLQYCGRQFHVFRRADKTCDTVNRTGGRRMRDTVHLAGLRCDGAAHGGCEAACLLFWKEAWLRPATDPVEPRPQGEAADLSAIERFVMRDDSTAETPAYRCQATNLPEFTTLLHWWDPRQYVRDLRTGNTSFWRFVRISSLAVFRKLIDIGVGTRALIRSYNWFQRQTGGRPYPIVGGNATDPQPVELDLKPGEYVRVKPLAEINATLDRHQKNRGLWFDQEMARFCGGTFRVQKRMTQIINERSGRMIRMKTPSVVLENVYCQSEFSGCRLFCPRSIYSYWREAWLERVEAPAGDS